MHSDSLYSYASGEYFVCNNEYSYLKHLGYKVSFIHYSSILQKLFKNKSFLGALLIINYIFSIEVFIRILIQLIIFKPNIIHLHGIFPHLSSSCLFAARLLKIPIVQTLHNVRWLCLEGGFFNKGRYCEVCLKKGYFHGVKLSCYRNKLASFLLYFSRKLVWNPKHPLQFINKFIAVSEYIKSKHVIAGIPDSKIIVKHNPVSTNNDYTTTDCFRSGIVYFGRVSKAKGSATLKLIAKHIKTNFNIIGDGPDLENLKDYCKSNKLDHVRFWNQQTQDKCFKIISSSVCTVVPSVCGESFSLTAAESMALSTPVVGFNVGGLSSLIKNSGGGLLVNTNSDEDFVKSVNQLIADHSYASYLGTLGQDYVKTHLDPDLNIKQLISIYKEVINSNKVK